MASSYRGSEKIENEAKRLGLIAVIANEESKRVLLKIKESGFYPQKIVDFGCGTGDAFTVFENIFPKAKIVGLDQSEKAVALARDLHPEAKLFIANFTEKDLLSETLYQQKKIDLAHFRNTLLHLPNPKDILREVMGHISEEGILFVQEPDWSMAEANWNDFTLFKESFTKMMLSVGINPYMGQQLKKMFEELQIQNINTDVSTKKIAATDSTWDILYSLLEVGGDRLNPYLQEKGVANIQEMRERIASAREIPGAYYTTPAWVIVWGNS